MSLGWRDLMATILTAGAVAITYAKLKDIELPLLGSWRMGTLALLMLGLGTCIIVGSGSTPMRDAWMITATVLGVLAFIIGVVGLVMDSRVAFVALAVDIVALWAVATLHHLTTAGA